MTRYLFRQLFASVIVLLLVITITFFMIQLAPGRLSLLTDPNMDPAVVRNIEQRFGLDQPVHIQYVRWIGNLLQGDMGNSLVFNRPVLTMITERLPATLTLGFASLLLTVIVGIPAGIIAARWPNSILDRFLNLVAMVGLAIPNFWLGILLISLFSVKGGWLPGAGMRTLGMDFSLLDRLSYLVLPSIVLATSTTAEL